jgi:hypothetical protein
MRYNPEQYIYDDYDNCVQHILTGKALQNTNIHWATDMNSGLSRSLWTHQTDTTQSFIRVISLDL